MKYKSLKISLAIFFGLLLLPSISSAYPLTSPNYQMQTGVIDNGGGENPTSTNFQIEGDSLAQEGILLEKAQAQITPCKAALLREARLKANQILLLPVLYSNSQQKLLLFWLEF